LSRTSYWKLIKDAEKKATKNVWDKSAYDINMQIIKLDDLNCPAYTRLARYYLEKKNFEYAKKVYEKVLEINPDRIGAWNKLQDLSKIERDNSIILHLKNHEEAYLAGLDFNMLNKPRLALECFQKAYLANPLEKSV
jgi:tetratricopeptide (TPR) repeat protein